jgi:hypothetical protein
VASLNTRVAVLEAITKQRADEQARALDLAVADLGRRLTEMNHWRAEEIQTKATLLRADTYDKSETQHMLERNTMTAAISALKADFDKLRTTAVVALAMISGAVALIGIVIPTALKLLGK